MFFRIAYKTPPLYRARGRAAPRQDPSSTDSEALNGLIFWFEGYDYFRAPEWGVDGDTSTPARPSQCRWRLPQRVVGLLATHGALVYWEIGCPVLGKPGASGL